MFASRTIPKGTVIIEYRGVRTSWEEASERQSNDAGDPLHTFIFAISDGRVIDASRRGNAARWINHSCAPNCKPYEDDEGRVFIEAARTIRAGDELTYDYQLELDERVTAKLRAEYACRCGAKRCRGTLLASR
ncbi:MAG TPA: SET domain-containing protein-lysine N-methyltransferase [Casimicrobiaceae bacterium]|nr:SET domain-containing protein-lysine N-methyltransferase [Casimicrobiaceae bacterium]